MINLYSLTNNSNWYVLLLSHRSIAARWLRISMTSIFFSLFFFANETVLIFFSRDFIHFNLLLSRMRLNSSCEWNLLIATQKKKKTDRQLAASWRRTRAVRGAVKYVCVEVKPFERRHFTQKSRVYWPSVASASVRPFTHSQIETHKMPESRRQNCANQLIIYVKLNKSASRTEYPPKNL